ncbi:sigma-70 family RNA polymerase sigma factor [Candidatus Omnitrophota bacterium]
MNFNELFKRLDTRLRKIAKIYGNRCALANEDDIYQEMCIHLWERFKDGLPEDMNESYAAKSCEFHILNYIRVKKDKAILMSTELPIGDYGYTLGETLVCDSEDIDRVADRGLTFEKIMSNGFTAKEKKVLVLLLKGYTARDAAKELGVSHVMIVKYKKSIINRWKKGYQD